MCKCNANFTGKTCEEKGEQKFNLPIMNDIARKNDRYFFIFKFIRATKVKDRVKIAEFVKKLEKDLNVNVAKISPEKNARRKVNRQKS